MFKFPSWVMSAASGFVSSGIKPAKNCWILNASKMFNAPLLSASPKRTSPPPSIISRVTGSPIEMLRSLPSGEVSASVKNSASPICADRVPIDSARTDIWPMISPLGLLNCAFGPIKDDCTLMLVSSSVAINVTGSERLFSDIQFSLTMNSGDVTDAPLSDVKSTRSM